MLFRDLTNFGSKWNWVGLDAQWSLSFPTTCWFHTLTWTSASSACAALTWCRSFSQKCCATQLCSPLSVTLLTIPINGRSPPSSFIVNKWSSIITVWLFQSLLGDLIPTWRCFRRRLLSALTCPFLFLSSLVMSTSDNYPKNISHLKLLFQVYHYLSGALCFAPSFR